MLKTRIIILYVMFLVAANGLVQEYIIQNLSIDNGLSNNYVKDLVQDGQGFIWVATETGLNRFDGQHFTKYTINNSNLANDAVNTLLWIGNYSSGVDFISHTKPLFHILPYQIAKTNRFKNKPVWGIYADNRSRVWVGGGNEIAIFKNNRLQNTTALTSYQSRPYTQVFSMKGNNQGTLLLGLYDDGLLHLDMQTI